MTRLSVSELDALIAGTEGVTPGPWGRKGASVQSVATGYIMETSGSGGYVGNLSSPRGSDQRDIDAEFIAGCDPATIKSLAEEVQELREALSKIANSVGPLGAWGTSEASHVSCIKIARNALNQENHNG